MTDKPITIDIEVIYDKMTMIVIQNVPKTQRGRLELQKKGTQIGKLLQYVTLSGVMTKYTGVFQDER